MNNNRILSAWRAIITAMAILCAISTSARETQKTVYIYGMAASFNDSTIYITNVQKLDSAYITDKQDLLYGRQDYSGQLKTYMQEQGHHDMTCITFFATTLKKAQKEYLKLRKRYLDRHAYIIKSIDPEAFTYRPVAPPIEQPHNP